MHTDLTWTVSVMSICRGSSKLKWQEAGLLAFVDSNGTDEEINAAVAMIYELEGKH